MPKHVNGILLLYHHPEGTNAPTIMEHVEALARHSRFRVWNYNTDSGFPRTLGRFRFSAIALHYSLFAPKGYKLDDYFLSYLDGSNAYKIAFFQDEHHYCQDRFAFLNAHRIDCVYTLLEPEYWPQVYGKYTHVPKLVHGIPGYVSDELVRHAEQTFKPDEEREIDIGYRGRTLQAYMGKGSQEKADVGTGFLEHARDSGLKLDIAVNERSRIYGDAWFEFLANCRGVLGTEAGVSIFDVEDTVRTEYQRLLVQNPLITFDELSEQLLGKWEDNIYYRTVSPRHFEAAALRVCQILFEGKYSGILEPMVHYLPLKKDFSNVDDVLRQFRDPDVRRRLTDNAHRDLIASERYSYRRFAESFDAELIAAGLDPDVDARVADRVGPALVRGERHLRRVARFDEAIHQPFPGRRAFSFVLHPIIRRIRNAYTKWRYRRFARRVASQSEN
jgi:hypothetical protein